MSITIYEVDRSGNGLAVSTAAFGLNTIGSRVARPRRRVFRRKAQQRRQWTLSDGHIPARVSSVPIRRDPQVPGLLMRSSRQQSLRAIGSGKLSDHRVDP